MLVGAAANSQRRPDAWRVLTGRTAPLALVLICLLVALGGCAKRSTAPTAQAPLRSPEARDAKLSPAAKDVLFAAIGLVGTPYRYGGNTPQGGFDCSGLVGYVYRNSAGVNLPRTTAEIAKVRGSNVGWGELISGDLVLFGRGRVDHIGIYVGEGRFVHAPSSGGTVRLDRLTDRYWRDRFRGGKRLF